MRVLAALCLLTACGGVEPSSDVEDAVVARQLVTLKNAPFAGHPAALVHLAKGFRPGGPVNLVVHYHGWANCIENDGEASAHACTPGGPKRIAHNLIQQIDDSGANAALVLVERAFDQNSSADGRLSQSGFFKQMIDELLPQIAPGPLGKIVLSSHSGGYRALADTLDRGGLTDHVTQVILLDSVYDNVAQFEAFGRGGGRLAVVYTDHAGTQPLSQKMAADARSWGFKLVDDRTFSTLSSAAFDAPLLFKRSALSHDGTAQYYFGHLLAHAGLD